jgi:hypothetical protein
MRYHETQIACPQCGKAATITNISFAIDGTILFKMLCILCEIPLELTTSWEKMICFCAEREVVNAQVLEGTKTVQ